ncbi:YbaB/EbfC family nucleoid-associated protein [Dactylosporangium darangshiense]
MYAEIQQQKVAISDFERHIAEAQTTVTAKNRAVSVTVDGRGELVDMKFPTNSYRTMAPAEFAQLLVETVGTARDQARNSAAALLQNLLPGRLPIADMLRGPVNFDSMMADVMKDLNEPLPGMADTANAEERKL